MKNIFLVAFLLITLLSTKAQSEHYYYYQGEKIYLDLDLKRISVNSFTQDISFLDGVLSDNFSINDVVPQYDKYMPLWYVISTSKEHENSLKLFNIFYESSLFETAEPELIEQIAEFSNDDFGFLND